MKKALILIGLATTLSGCHLFKSHHHSKPTSTTDTVKSLQSSMVKASDIDFLEKRMTIGKNEELQLDKADWTGSSTGESGYDAGMNAVKNGESVSKQFGGVKGYFSEKSAVYLRDPAVTGWKYQTFGQVITKQGGSAGYVNVGKPYTPTESETIKANYQGIAMGTLNKESEVIANMTAELAWGTDNKELMVNVTDSKIATQNAVNGYNGLSNAEKLDFSEKMQWNAKEKMFKGSTTQAHLYGKAKEMGGTFNQTIDGKKYQGAFAGSQQ